MTSPVRVSRRQFVVRSSVVAGVAAGGALACAGRGAGDPAAEDGDAAADVGAGDTSVDGAVSADTRPEALDTGFGEDTSADAPADAADAPDAASCASATVTISMVHVNDIHGNYNVDASGSSPVARIVGFYEQTRAENPHTIFSNAGDDFEKGSVTELMSGGLVNAEITRAMGFHIRCIGNHDFAWGQDSVLDFSDDPVAQTLSSNVGYTGPDPTRWRAQVHATREVDCVRVGYFGMVGRPWNEFNEQVDGDYFPEFPMRHDYAERARELVAELRSRVDIVVMCSHLGLGADRELAAAVDGIDVVLGGHSHTLMSTEEIVNGTIIIQAGSSAGFIARLDIDVDRETRAIRAHRYTVVPNLAAFAPVHEETNARVVEILARLAPGALDPVGRLGAGLTNAGVAQLMSRAAAAQLDVDAVVVDIGTVWASLGRGAVTRQDFLDSFKVERQPAGTPGFNSFGVATIAGAGLAQVVAALPVEWGYTGPGAGAIEVDRSYRIALQRNVAGRSTAIFGDAAALADYALAGECWSILTEWAEARTAAGALLDAV